MYGSTSHQELPPIETLHTCASGTLMDYYSTQGWPPDPPVLLHCAGAISEPTKYYSAQGWPPDTNPH
eukprot:3624682-Ditylum_brightwellii.AAC.1